MIQNSPYELYMQKADFKVLCKVTLTLAESKMLAARIKEDYRVQMIMDNLPAATRMISELPDGKTVTMYDRGYRLGFFGFKQSLSEPPVRTNEIPRQIPLQAWYMSTPFTMLVGGILPFGAVFIELFFIMSSVWLQRFYYVFGFLALVMIILLITCSEIAI